MWNTRPLALLALVLVASYGSAQSTAVSSSTLIGSYALGPGIAFGGYTMEEYGSGATTTDGGNAIADTGASTTHSHVDGTAMFTLGSLTSATLHSSDYASITPGADPYAISFLGYAYLLTFTAGAAGGTVSFDLHATQSSIGSAAGPAGLQAYDPNAQTYSSGAYATGAGFAGAFDAGDRNDPNPETELYSISDSTSHEDTTLTPTSTYDAHGSRTFNKTFTFAPNQTRVLGLFASSRAQGDYLAPVPEPASAVALGVGTLCLLRRRRKA